MVMHRFGLVLGLAALATLSACDGGSDGESEGVANLCNSESNPLVELGEGVGGAYEAYQADQTVALSVAPQGGFGVSVVIRTEGLVASEESMLGIQLNVELDGELAGEFDTSEPFRCGTDGRGGRVFGTVVGFYPDRFGSSDDLVALSGKVATLDVTVTDSSGVSANARLPVTISAEG